MREISHVILQLSRVSLEFNTVNNLVTSFNEPHATARDTVMLSTIGYEGASLKDFVATIAASTVEVLVDVRERAQSRRRGFSKTVLSDALAEIGVEYLHFPELGDPKEGREAARAGDWKKFKRIYSNVIRRKAAQYAIEEIIEIAKSSNACLLCYERDPFTCHRKIITDKIAASKGIMATHLGVRQVESSSSHRRRVLHPREGIAASV